MKNLFALLAISFILLFAGCKEESINAIEYQKINLNFYPYEVYSIDSSYKMNDSGSFEIFSNIWDLMLVFRHVKVGMNYSSILDSTFIDSLAVAVIKPKTIPLTLKFTAMSLENKVLSVRYNLSYEAADQFGFFYYALATFKRCDFNLVKFYQNDTLVKVMRYP